MAVDDSIRIFSGSAHPALANDVAAYLELPLAKCHIDRFADGEVHFVIGESVRGKDVYVIQSLRKPVNDFVVEMLVMIDALRRASARSITAVLPYFAYARQDRQDRPRTPISARLMADLLQAAGVHRVMAMDLHAGQIQGFFDVPVDHLNAGQVLLEAMRRPSRWLRDRVARRRRRGACAALLDPDRWFGAGDHRQAPVQAERGRGDARGRGCVGARRLRG